MKKLNEYLKEKGFQKDPGANKYRDLLKESVAILIATNKAFPKADREETPIEEVIEFLIAQKGSDTARGCVFNGITGLYHHEFKIDGFMYPNGDLLECICDELYETWLTI